MPYEFIYPFIQENISKLLLHQTGGAQQHINKQDVEGLMLKMPTAVKIDQFRKQVGPMYAAIANNCFENKYLCEMRDVLIPKLMSGELNVSDTEI